MNRILIATAATLLIASPALAAPKGTQMKLNLAGLDLSTNSGAREALNRIDQAAKDACSLEMTGSRQTRVSASCVTEMTGNAVRAINAPLLVALAKTKGSTTVTSGSSPSEEAAAPVVGPATKTVR